VSPGVTSSAARSIFGVILSDDYPVVWCDHLGPKGPVTASQGGHSGPNGPFEERAWCSPCDPERNLEGSRRFPFATIVIKDYGDFDNLSNLNREGVFRFNIGVSKETFRKLFPDEREHDFTALDTLIPHPVYAVNHWVSVLNPSDETFARIKPLLDEAYETAVRRNRDRSPR
jgi:hypothetical protein